MIETGQFEYSVADIPVVCSHCRGTRFEKSSALLDTGVASLFGFEFLNDSADVLACRRCGHLEWFVRAQGDSMPFVPDPEPSN